MFSTGHGKLFQRIFIKTHTVAEELFLADEQTEEEMVRHVDVKSLYSKFFVRLY
jgi:hypothetical protein